MYDIIKENFEKRPLEVKKQFCDLWDVKEITVLGVLWEIRNREFGNVGWQNFITYFMTTDRPQAVHVFDDDDVDIWNYVEDLQTKLKKYYKCPSEKEVRNFEF